MADAVPKIWILSRGRKGDLDQMLALAKASGWDYEAKHLRFAGPEIPLLSRLLLQNGNDVLTPPWPDFVLCAEASPSVIARAIRRASGGKTRAVCLGRPAGSAAGFDLVITTAQYRVPPAANVVELSMPLAADAGAEAEAGGPVPEGVIALLVGGIGVANTMIISVLERRREIGLRRSLGAMRGHILVQFMTEALLLASLGGALGCVIGIGVTAGMSAANGWPFSLPVIAVVGGLGVTIAIGALAGVYPAVRASRTPPTAALNAQ